MLGTMLAHAARRMRSGLAVWLVALLAMAPAAGASLPVEPAAVRTASVQSFDLRDQATKAREPGTGPRVQPTAPGASLRLSLIEPTPGLSPLDDPPDRFGVANGSLVAPKLNTAFVSNVTDAFHRSSVGTARTPTGPPS